MEEPLVDGVDACVGVGGARVHQSVHGGNELPCEILLRFRGKLRIREGFSCRIDNGPGVFSVKFGPTDDCGGRNFLVLVLQEIAQRSLGDTSVAVPIGLCGGGAQTRITVPDKRFGVPGDCVAVEPGQGDQRASANIDARLAIVKQLTNCRNRTLVADAGELFERLCLHDPIPFGQLLQRGLDIASVCRQG